MHLTMDVCTDQQTISQDWPTENVCIDQQEISQDWPTEDVKINKKSQKNGQLKKVLKEEKF